MRFLKSFLLSTALVSTTAFAAQADVKVVASIKPVHSLVAAVMEGVGTPSLIVEGAGSPHTYALKPSQARELQDAQVVFWMGHELEAFLEKPIEAIAGKAKAVELLDAHDLVKLEFREGGAFDAHDHDDHEGEEHGHDDHGHDEHEHEKHADGHDHDEHEHEEHADGHDHDEHEHEEHADGRDHDEHEEHADADDHDEHEHEKHADGHDHDEHEHEEHADAHDHDEHEHEEHADAHDHDEHEHEEHADAHDHDKHEHEEHADAHDHDEHEHEKHADGHDHDEHAHGEFDPHVWLDPVNAKALVHEIEEVLAEVDPENARKYEANAEAVMAKLDALTAEVSGELASLEGRGFVVFHDAYQNFENRFGLTAVGSITVSPEVMPGAERIGDLRAKVKELDATCVFSEPQFESRLVATVTEGTNAKSGVLDPLGADIENGPELYFTLIRNMATSFKACLSESS